MLEHFISEYGKGILAALAFIALAGILVWLAGTDGTYVNSLVGKLFANTFDTVKNIGH